MPANHKNSTCSFSRINPFLFLIPVVTALVLTACTGKDDGKKKRIQVPHLVATTQSRIRTLSTATTRTGTIDVLRRVKIYSQEEGKITRLPYYPGDTFNKGDVLVQMDSGLLKAQLDKAVATRNQAKQDLKRTTSMVNKHLVAEDVRARSETALRVAMAEEELLRTRMEYTRILAPFSGTVSERLIEPGDIAPKYKQLMTIIDRRSLVARVNVSELLLPLLKKGDPAGISIDSLGDRQFKGVISRIYPTVNASTRLGTIEVSFEKIPEHVRAGSLCRVTLIPPKKPYLIIPFTGLRRDGKGEFIFTITKESNAKKIYVRTGMRHGNLITITDGIGPNIPIITKGFLGLRDGKKVSTQNNKIERNGKKTAEQKPGRTTG